MLIQTLCNSKGIFSLMAKAKEQEKKLVQTV